MRSHIAIRLLLGSACLLSAALRPLPVLAEEPATFGDVGEAVPDPETPVAAAASPLADDSERLAAETVAAMQQAQAGLAGGQLTADFDARQTAIMERLQQLAELARQQSKSISSGRSSSGGARSGSAADSGDGQGATGRNDDAAESSESALGQSGGASPARTPHDLTTSVWGHLPARQRDRMRSRFSERFLPQYAELVRQYYEALATDGAAESGRAPE